MAAENFYSGSSLSITAVEGIPAEVTNRLAALGLLDADQFLDAVAAPTTARHVADFLGITPGQLDVIAGAVSRALPPAIAAAPRGNTLEDLPRGAFPPDEADEDNSLLIPYDLPPPTATALPPMVNNAAILGQRRNQGNRGTCVAFAVTAIHEYHSKKNGQNIDYSEQFLYDETKKIDGTPNQCGTWQVKAAKVLLSLGQCPENVWPYNGQLPCNNNGTQPAGAKAAAATHKLQLSTLPRNNVAAIKSTLAAGQVVGFSIPVFDSWYQNATSRTFGRITMPLPNEAQNGGHAMCLVGYQNQADVPGGGYFILRNSWFGAWGQQNPYGSGNGVIPYDYIARFNWEALTH